LTPPAIVVPELAPRLANIEAEHAYMQRMNYVKRELEEFADKEVLISAVPSLSLAAARNWATQIVALAYRVVAAHEAAYAAEQGLRAVEPEQP
jgi:hypothetical protein